METLIIVLGIAIVGIIVLKKVAPTKYEEIKLNLQNWTRRKDEKRGKMTCFF